MKRPRFFFVLTFFVLAVGIAVVGYTLVSGSSPVAAPAVQAPDPLRAEPAAPWRTLPWRLEPPPGAELVARATEKSNAPGSEDYAVTYGVVIRQGMLRRPAEIGRVTVTERRLNNGDVFLFSRLASTGSSEVRVRLVLELDGHRFDLTDFARRDKPHEHHPVSGVDPTTYPIGLVNTYDYDRLRWSLVAGRQYVSRELVLRYEGGNESRLRELVEERKDIAVHSDGEVVRLEFPLGAPAGTLAEHWLVVSRQPLFRDERVLDAWIRQSIDEYLAINRWYTPGGTYTKLPWSVEPFTRLGYGRHLGNTQEEKVLEHYRRTRERYFYDLVLNAVAVLHRQRDPELGLWLTEYTSTWLKKQYGIIAPYVDTRHNEKVGKFLAQAGRLLGLPELERAGVAYADFLVQQARAGHVIPTAPGGYLIVDYFVPGNDLKTHASLNHALAEMNYLLEAYQFTPRPEYLAVARAIRRGIEALGDRWIRENGDLWYRVNPDLTFEGTDYVLLTLYDLLAAQRDWRAVGEEPSPVFDRFIRSKVRYLLKSGQHLPAEIRRQLREQGFGDLLAGGK
ncbi:MAG TPA: hypothetical protein VIK99_10570 [Thermaerobacter sp.]